MNWIPVIAIALSIVAIWLAVKLGGWIYQVYLILKYNSALKQSRIKEDEESALIRKGHEDYMAKHQSKIDAMKAKGYDSTSDDYYWIERENGKIKRLYNLDGKRVPLAELSKLSGANIIGNEPVLHYYGELIGKYQMLEDEAEIRKLNV